MDFKILFEVFKKTVVTPNDNKTKYSTKKLDHHTNPYVAYFNINFIEN